MAEKTVEAFIESNPQWQEGLEKVRSILKKTDLEEGIKWGVPCYGYGKKNLIGLGAHKHHMSIAFFQGATIDDTDDLFINCQPGKTQAMRQIRIEDVADIKVRQITKYVKAAIESSKAGKEIKPKKGKEVIVPEQLQAAMKKSKKLEQAYQKLTPGKQREYCNHIAEAKQEKTKLSRLEKIKPMIIQGIGLNDKYRNC